MEVSLNQTDAKCSSQRSSMQGQQRPLSFLQRRQASLRVNTCTDACGRGGSPAPYSPSSAETVVGGGEGLNPYTHVRGADLSIQALSTCSTAKQVSLPPNTPLVFLSTIWAQEASVCAANLIQEAQTNICRYSPTKWLPSPPISGGKKGGGATQLHR